MRKAHKKSRARGRIPRTLKRRRAAAYASHSGFLAGYGEGYHWGRCQAVVNHAAGPVNPVRHLKVMYVAQGTPGFHTMDVGITEALRLLVTTVIQVSGGDPVADLAIQHRPDLVIVLNGLFNVDTGQIDRIRQAGIPTCVWIADDPYFSDQTGEIARHYDYVFTHERSCIPLYQNAGLRHVFYLPFGVSPSLFTPKAAEVACRTDILFIGMAFPNRIAFFDQIARHLADKRVLIAGGGWQTMASYALLRDRIRLEGIHPEQTGTYYNGAKIVINLHRSEVESGNSRNFPGLSVNPRTFEINACGTLQLVDNRSELAAHYQPGIEIETFSSPEELVGKIDYYLRNDSSRRDIAVKGLKRTLNNHTYMHRLTEMLSLIGSRGGVPV